MLFPLLSRLSSPPSEGVNNELLKQQLNSGGKPPTPAFDRVS